MWTYGSGRRQRDSVSAVLAGEALPRDVEREQVLLVAPWYSRLVRPSLRSSPPSTVLTAFDLQDDPHFRSHLRRLHPSLHRRPQHLPLSRHPRLLALLRHHPRERRAPGRRDPLGVLGCSARRTSGEPRQGTGGVPLRRAGHVERGREGTALLLACVDGDAVTIAVPGGRELFYRVGVVGRRRRRKSVVLVFLSSLYIQHRSKAFLYFNVKPF